MEATFGVVYQASKELLLTSPDYSLQSLKVCIKVCNLVRKELGAFLGVGTH